MNCGEVDPITGAVCDQPDAPHINHSFSEYPFEFRWKTVTNLILPTDRFVAVGGILPSLQEGPL